MSTCIKDLYDYDLIKKCLKCGYISLKSNFHKHQSMNDCLQPRCKFCCKKYYLENCDRLINNQNLYAKQNRNKISTRMNEYFKKKQNKTIRFDFQISL